MNRPANSMSHAWRALRHRNFKLFFAGQSVSLLSAASPTGAFSSLTTLATSTAAPSRRVNALRAHVIAGWHPSTGGIAGWQPDVRAAHGWGSAANWPIGGST